jgi:hypothetical protein
MNPSKGNAFTALKITSNTEVINKVTEVATSNQLTIAHVDLNRKLKKSDRSEKIQLLQKVDEWCDTVYQHVSINGMFVVIFSGPNSIPRHQSDSSISPNAENSTDTNNIISNESSSKTAVVNLSPTSNVPILPNPNKKPKNKPRRNGGVCFIHVRRGANFK